MTHHVPVVDANRGTVQPYAAVYAELRNSKSSSAADEESYKNSGTALVLMMVLVLWLEESRLVHADYWPITRLLLSHAVMLSAQVSTGAPGML